MKRRDFIKSSFGASVGAVAFNQLVRASRKENNALLASITKANDQTVENLLVSHQGQLHAASNRALSGFILSLCAAYCAEDSEYHLSTNLIVRMEEAAEVLLQNQYPDGTFDAGNLQSPPDSAFMVEQFCRAQALLQNNASNQVAHLKQSMQKLILSAGEALTTGGVHTPNHRWAVCAALSRTHSLYPNQKYVHRIDDWLGEGIDQDDDGQFSERSPNYDSAVNNPGLLDVAVLLDRPELLDYIRKNLEMSIYLTELNGEVDTVASRRQDQAQDRSVMIHRYYVPYRYLAIKDGNPRFARMTRMIETTHMKELGRYLPDFLLFSKLNEQLPTPGFLPHNYAKHLAGAGLVRIRRGRLTAAVFGGTDWHLGHGVWSGLSHNPTFFKLRKGDAILESVRMSPAFFRTGYFRSNCLTVDDNGTYHLQEERRVPYHQPLPKDYRNERGDYELSPDGRFFSKMDFENRPKDYKTLRSEVRVKEKSNNGTFELDISVGDHSGVAVTLELCFRKGGRLEGVTPRMDDEDGYFLDEGYGMYSVGNDVIEFGPGSLAHTRFVMHNEQYSVHNGGIREEGYRVYITGITPFDHSLRIR